MARRSLLWPATPTPEKSTLFNRFTRAGVRTEDKLFATLDSRLRKGSLGGTTTAIFVDTVGFIRKLPHHLVDSFRSTLEEISQADLVLHVVDRNHPRWHEHMDIGKTVLTDLGVDSSHVLPVLNKADRCDAETGGVNGGWSVSAKTGDGIEELKNYLLSRLAGTGHRRVVAHAPKLFRNTQNQRLRLAINSTCAELGNISNASISSTVYPASPNR